MANASASRPCPVACSAAPVETQTASSIAKEACFETSIVCFGEMKSAQTPITAATAPTARTQTAGLPAPVADRSERAELEQETQTEVRGLHGDSRYRSGE